MSYTQSELREEARQAVKRCHELLRVSPDVEAHKISLCLAEITLATLSAMPVDDETDLAVLRQRVIESEAIASWLTKENNRLHEKSQSDDNEIMRLERLLESKPE